MTAADAVDHVHRILWDGPLRTAVTGQLRRYARPPGSGLEDVTVSLLGAADGRRLQTATVNVNVFVPCPPHAAAVDGKPATLRDTPDEARVRALAALAAAALRTRYDRRSGVLAELRGQQVFPDGEQTVIACRVRVTAKNASSGQLTVDG